MDVNDYLYELSQRIGQNVSLSDVRQIMQAASTLLQDSESKVFMESKSVRVPEIFKQILVGRYANLDELKLAIQAAVVKQKSVQSDLNTRSRRNKIMLALVCITALIAGLLFYC